MEHWLLAYETLNSIQILIRVTHEKFNECIFYTLLETVTYDKWCLKQRDLSHNIACVHKLITGVYFDAGGP